MNAVAREVRGAAVCALARAVPFDVDAAAEALRGAEAPRIHAFVNASDVQLAHQLRKGRDEVLGMVEYAVARARNATDDVEFSPMDATRADPEFLVDVVRAALAAGARTINMPDTVGYALPDQVAALIAQLRARVPELEEAVISFHGQDDLGLATANALAAIRAGARQVELAVNGIGERAGNTAFEEVVMAIAVHGARARRAHRRWTRAASARSRRWSSSTAASRCRATRRWSARTRSATPRASTRTACSSGARTTRCSTRPRSDTRAAREIVLGKLSGRAGFVARAKQLGFCLADAALDAAFDRFQRSPTGRPVVEDDDLRSICAAV